MSEVLHSIPPQQTWLIIGTSTVFPARFRLDRTVAKLYFARKWSAAVAKRCNPRVLLERRVMGICIGSDRAVNVGLETTNGITLSAKSKRRAIGIMA